MPRSESLTTAEFVAESHRRAASIETRRHRRRSIAVAAVSGAVGLAAIVGVALVLSIAPLGGSARGGTGIGADAIGAADAGACVLVGIVCFVLGVVVTLVSVRYAARHPGRVGRDS
ncbi:MAG: hypothetical protein FWC46_00800 [Actinomycetia bacterium]|nr:hypothetical protein [Actinomycetes bacterium]